MDYADDTKVNLIAWLLPHLKLDQVIGTELFFLDGKHRADIVVASMTTLSAFEIKGPRDDLRKLARQMAAYRRMFLEVWLVAPRERMPVARSVIPKAIGLIAMNRSGLEVMRRPKPRGQLRRTEAVRWLRTDELLSLLRGVAVGGSDRDIESLRTVARNRVSAKRLSKAALASVQDRLSPRFGSFRRELSGGVTLDDLMMLQLPNSVA